jgi:hypothetical protein
MPTDGRRIQAPDAADFTTQPAIPLAASRAAAMQ